MNESASNLPRQVNGVIETCTNVADIRRAREFYESLFGFDVMLESEVRWEQGGTSIYFRDPENNLLELARPVRGPTTRSGSWGAAGLNAT